MALTSRVGIGWVRLSAALVRRAAIALLPVMMVLATVTLPFSALAASPKQPNPTCSDGKANNNAKSSANSNARRSCAETSSYVIHKPSYNLDRQDPSIIASLVFAASGSARPVVAEVQLSTMSRPCFVEGQNSPWIVRCVFPENAESVRAASMFAVILSTQ